MAFSAKTKSACEILGRDTLFDEVRAAGLGEKMLGEMNHRLKKQKKRRRTAGLAAGAGIVALGFLFWAIPYATETSTASAPPSEFRNLVLQDGSRAELNARTHIASDFRYGRRTVKLSQGEAYFSVVSDPSHPFLVITDQGTVRVTGTEFNVRLDSSGAAEVTLIRGRIEFERDGTPPTVLTPGEQATVAGSLPTVLALNPHDLAQVLAWRQGKIILDGMTLEAATARFAQFHDVTIQVDPSVARLRLGGAYSLSDLPHFLHGLEETNSLNVQSLPDGSYRITAR